MRGTDRRLIDQQIEYYKRRAPEYDQTTIPPGDPWVVHGMALEAALRRFGPRGDVLEIACGTGTWTKVLLADAFSITALDSSLEMLELARAKVGADDRVTFEQTDVFSWEPGRRYDVVFFANWLSHIPDSLLPDFWSLVDRSLEPEGRVFLIDETEDVRRQEERLDATRVARHLLDGEAHVAVKVMRSPVVLQDLLAVLGWRADVKAEGPFLHASVTRA